MAQGQWGMCCQGQWSLERVDSGVKVRLDMRWFGEIEGYSPVRLPSCIIVVENGRT